MSRAHCSTEIHEATKRDEAAWRRLTPIGEQMGLELRNCPCGSTLARPLPVVRPESIEVRL